MLLNIPAWNTFPIKILQWLIFKKYFPHKKTVDVLLLIFYLFIWIKETDFKDKLHEVQCFKITEYKKERWVMI